MWRETTNENQRGRNTRLEWENNEKSVWLESKEQCWGKKKKKGKLKIQHDQIEVYITLGLITIVTE